MIVQELKTKGFILYLLMHSILLKTKIVFIICLLLVPSLFHILITALTSTVFIVHKINTAIEGKLCLSFVDS